MQAKTKIISFCLAAMKYIGKEITLPSNEHFIIDCVIDEEKAKNGKYDYMIHYGFPQSGCIVMKAELSTKSNSCSVSSITVYAPQKEGDIIMTDFDPQIGTSVNLVTPEHSDISKTDENPNALFMLDIAIYDLNNAQVIGKCSRLAVPGSTHIPCCNSTQVQSTKEK